MHRESWRRMYAWLDIASDLELDQRLEELETLLDTFLAPDHPPDPPQMIQNASVRQDILQMLRDIEHEKLLRVMCVSSSAMR